MTGGSYKGQSGTFVKVVGIGVRARIVLDGEDGYRTLTYQYMEPVPPSTTSEYYSDEKGEKGEKSEKSSRQLSLPSLIEEAKYLERRMAQLVKDLEALQVKE
jgi:hypothetical protein